MIVHDHKGKSEKHVHLNLDEIIVCKVCGWRGTLRKCESFAAPFDGTSYSCPNVVTFFLLFKKRCGTFLAIDGEEGGIRTLDGADIKTLLAENLHELSRKEAEKVKKSFETILNPRDM